MPKVLQRSEPMKQLKLPLEWIQCRYYNDCDAPLCPEDINLKGCLWFPNEPICRLRKVPGWVHKQRKISGLKGINPEKYFTLRMLNRIEKLGPTIEGADPELFGGEKLWAARQSTKGIRAQKSKPASNDTQMHGTNTGTYPLF